MSKAEEQARHYLLNEHSSPLTRIMHEADLKAEMQYHKDIENGYIKGYEQAEKDFMEKAAKWLKSCLDNGCWVANNLCDYDKWGIVQGFKEMMSE